MAVGRTKLAVFTMVLAAAAMAALVLPVLPWLTRLFESIAALGPWGPGALIGVYIIACVFLIPASIPTFASGLLFGVFRGSLVAMAGGVLGACAAYWLGMSWQGTGWPADPSKPAVHRARRRGG
jgi:uncharacterized membrane protein YdjX (TVP38/TMEM64 family)